MSSKTSNERCAPRKGPAGRVEQATAPSSGLAARQLQQRTLAVPAASSGPGMASPAPTFSTSQAIFSPRYASFLQTLHAPVPSQRVATPSRSGNENYGVQSSPPPSAVAQQLRLQMLAHRQRQAHNASATPMASQKSCRKSTAKESQQPTSSTVAVNSVPPPNHALCPAGQTVMQRTNIGSGLRTPLSMVEPQGLPQHSVSPSTYSHPTTRRRIATPSAQSVRKRPHRSTTAAVDDTLSSRSNLRSAHRQDTPATPDNGQKDRPVGRRLCRSKTDTPDSESRTLIPASRGRSVRNRRRATLDEEDEDFIAPNTELIEAAPNDTPEPLPQPLPPSQRELVENGYTIPRELEGIRMALGAATWKAYVELMESFVDGTINGQRLDQYTEKLFSVSLSGPMKGATMSKIKLQVNKMVVGGMRERLEDANGSDEDGEYEMEE